MVELITDQPTSPKLTYIVANSNKLADQVRTHRKEIALKVKGVDWIFLKPLSSLGSVPFPRRAGQ